MPKDLEEAALVDGCTANTAFWRIILPLSAPAMAVTALFGFMSGWTEIILAWTMLEQPRYQKTKTHKKKQKQPKT